MSEDILIHDVSELEDTLLSQVVGSLHDEEGVEQLLEAYDTLTRDHPDLVVSTRETESELSVIFTFTK